MAGWIQWTDVQIATSSSIGKTVLETMWPRITEIATQAQWPAAIWVDRMLALVSDVILRAKGDESRVLNQEESLQRAVQAGEIFANSQFHQGVCRFATPEQAIEWFMRWVNSHPPRARDLNRAILDQINLPANRDLQNLLPNAENVRPGWATMTFDIYMRWLYTTQPDVAVTTIIGNALIAYVSGMCKLGEMSAAWQASRIRQIRREAQNPDLEIQRPICTHVWDMYGVAFRPQAGQFGPFFTWMENQCQAKSMTRLFITAQQAAEQGCTVLNLIGDAQRDCDDFNWDRFHHPNSPAERAIHTEMEKWSTDFTLMKENPWLRFEGSIGRSPQMANLGYLAKQLLTRAMGQMSVSNYAGLDLGNLTIRHRAWIDRVVQQYIEHINARPEGAEAPVAKLPGQRNLQHRLLNAGVARAAAAVPNFAGAPLPPPGPQLAPNIPMNIIQANPDMQHLHQLIGNPLIAANPVLAQQIIQQLQVAAQAAQQAPLINPANNPILNQAVPPPVPQANAENANVPVIAQQGAGPIVGQAEGGQPGGAGQGLGLPPNGPPNEFV